MRGKKRGKKGQKQQSSHPEEKFYGGQGGICGSETGSTTNEDGRSSEVGLSHGGRGGHLQKENRSGGVITLGEREWGKKIR